ncbi:MotA/TolQ/ExbB proton channel family protein [Xylanibacter ruminicola]|uniref:Outer membrane transport energization protein ExbB n=1 Tax=Xylanibacter ruminicola TaxID=839 RepID=A0A1M6XYN2_XYLRU|nr:MotA/TolQ/ExbB proton channel family protein [Xylanibacter ruminicola]SHL11111.1 outer membrane transport energization protein ExbB [Xylanibacter ruminicola]
MHYISDILYWISTGLLVPVIVLLIILFGRALLLIGSFFGQYLSVRKTEALLKQEFNTLDKDTVSTLPKRLPKGQKSLVVNHIQRMLQHQNSEAHLQKLLSDFEIASMADLATSKTLAKMGPMLGLMGTLIPMGPALVGLSTGDIASMAYNMQVAFATTVVGLFSAAIGFITGQVKSRWYQHDRVNLQFLADLLTEK